MSSKSLMEKVQLLRSLIICPRYMYGSKKYRWSTYSTGNIVLDRKRKVGSENYLWEETNIISTPDFLIEYTEVEQVYIFKRYQYKINYIGNLETVDQIITWLVLASYD